MTEEMQRCLDVQSMKKLAVKVTKSHLQLTDPPDSFVPYEHESWNLTTNILTAVAVAEDVTDEVVLAVLEFQSDP